MDASTESIPDDLIRAQAPTVSAHTDLDSATDEVVGGPLIELPVETQYRCPGESHSISQSVHLSRLAAFYPACRQCQHRHETGHLPPRTIEGIQRVEQRAPQRPLFQQDGVRGVFHNDISPGTAGRITRAFARLLWQDVPLTGRVSSTANRGPTRRGPTVVAGYDERPSSPALLASVIDALRLMGCPVIDVGLVSRPCFAFAVDHLQAAGGIFVTGSGCDAAWTGLDLLSEGALPLSLGSGLEQVEAFFNEGQTRPTRRAAYQRSFQATVPYEAGLWKLFHALRPLRIVVAARPRPVRQTLRTLFAKLPCELVEVEASAAGRAPVRFEALIQRLCQRVIARKAHLGILIDDDGARCWFLDERGQRIESIAITKFLASVIRAEHPTSPVVVETSAIEAFQSALPQCTTIDGGATAGSVCQTVREVQSYFAGGTSDRWWFREGFPANDGIRTLARVLQGLSQSDTPFSKAVATVSN